MCFLGVFCSLYDPAPVLGSPSEGLGAELLTRRWQICLFWTAAMMRELTRGKGGGGRRWGESERWKWRMEGRRTQRSGASDPQGPGLTQRRPPLLCPPRLFPPPPPLLCHSGLDYFILIRLIPPRGKLLITSPPPTPPDESNLLSAWGQDEGEGLLRLIGDKNVKGETEKGPWQQLWSASMRRFGPPRLDKLAGGTPFVAIDPPTSL